MKLYTKAMTSVIVVLMVTAGLSTVYAGSVSEESLFFKDDNLKVDSDDELHADSIDGIKKSFEGLKEPIRNLNSESYLSWFQQLRNKTSGSDREFPKSLYRSQPVTIEGVGGQWDMIVPDNYKSIQDAIDNVGPTNGYRIFVRSGTYHENIVIDTDGITLHGENREDTIIDGSGRRDVLFLDSSYNNISGFTIRNSGYNCAGVWMHRSHANNIKNNIISDNSHNGIIIGSSSLANTVSNNQIMNNQQSGVCIDGASRSNLIAGNQIESNSFGVKITDISENNMVHHNQFIGNDQNAFDDSTNFWDDTVGEGNYWSDYNGTDSDGDGIGESPYVIYGGDNVDRYPLMIPPAMRSFSINGENSTEKSVSFSNNDHSFSGNTIIVPDDYSTIQEAVDHADDGDTIQVKPGIYFENLVVDKSVSIVGSGSENTMVFGNGMGHVFKIVDDNVLLSDFTIGGTDLGYAGIKIKSDYANVTIQNNNIQDCGDGINVGGFSHTILWNIITGCNFGIYCDAVESIKICNNTIEDNGDGMAVWFSSKLYIKSNIIKDNCVNGVLQLWSNKNKIYNCILQHNYFGLTMFSSKDNQIKNNEIYNNNNDGISLHKSNDNIFTGNYISNNRISALSLWFYSNNNIIANNNFTSNQGWIFIVIVNSKNNIIDTNIFIDNMELESCSCGGIIFSYSSNNTIINNIIPNGDGIYFSHSNNNIISNNTLNNNVVSIGLEDYCSNNTIIDNTLTFNEEISILLAYCCHNNTIARNTISDNMIGVAIIFSKNNIIYQNNFIRNSYQHALFNNYVDSYNIINLILILGVNKWNRNYWDDWSRFFPRQIYGEITIDVNGGYREWFNFDWHPATEPYDIPL